MKVEKKNMDRLLKDLEWSERVAEMPFFFENLPEPPKKILDVGCCYSPLVVILEEMGYDSWGVDMIPYGVPCAKFVQDDARCMDFEDNSFDVVTSISVIEHIGLVHTPYKTDSIHDETGDIKAFDEIVRVARPNGTIIVTIPYGLGSDGLRPWVRFYDKIRLHTLLTINENFVLDKLRFTKCVGLEWLEITQAEAETIASEPNKVLCNLCILGHKK